MRHEVSKKLIKELHRSIKQFGEYNFYDKGVDEIMDVSPYDDLIRDLPFEEFMDVVCDLMEDKYAKEFATNYCEDTDYDFDEMKDFVIKEGVKIEDYTYFSDALLLPEPVEIGSGLTKLEDIIKDLKGNK